MAKEKNLDPKKDNPFLVNWAENIPPEALSGDSVPDDRLEENDQEGNLTLRMSEPAGGPFMHPMHDATADPYPDEPSADNEDGKHR